MNSFNKKLTSILSAILFCQSFSAPVLAETVHENAITGWRVVYSDDADGSTAFESGIEENSVAVAINQNTDSEISISREVETESGKKYEVIAKIKTKNLKNAYLYAEEKKLDFKIGTSDWSEYRMAFIADEEKSEIGIKSTGEGSVVIDEVIVKDAFGKEIYLENSDFEMSGEETTSNSETNLASDKESYTRLRAVFNSLYYC